MEHSLKIAFLWTARFGKIGLTPDDVTVSVVTKMEGLYLLAWLQGWYMVLHYRSSSASGGFATINPFYAGL